MHTHTKPCSGEPVPSNACSVTIMIQTYPNRDGTKKTRNSLTYPHLHIDNVTVTTKLWGISFNEGETKEHCCKAHYYCEFHKVHPHMFGAYPVKKMMVCYKSTVSFLTGGMFRFHVSIFWRYKSSEIDFTGGNPEKKYWREVTLLFFSQKKSVPNWVSQRSIVLIWRGLCRRSTCQGQV